MQGALALSLVLLGCFVAFAPVDADLVTASQFKCMFPRVPDSKVNAWMPYLNTVLTKYNINTLPRVWMFMAQTGHETDSYNTFVEYTNPDGTNPWCGGYEGGCRYRGRGVIQLTHRSNYQRAGNELGVDFVGNPDLVATNQYAFTVGGQYWTWTGLNGCSDAGDITTCTKKINGGTNGLQDRINKYNLAKQCITSGGKPGCVVPGVGSGTCQEDSSACSGSYYSGYCPGANNIRCCVTDRPACSVPDIGSGTCQEDSLACSGSYFSGHCPGAANIKCCITNRPACSVPNVGSGTCQEDSSACSGSYYSGHCPGAGNIKCCVPRVSF